MEDRHKIGFSGLTRRPERYPAIYQHLEYPRGEVASHDSVQVQERNPLINVERTRHDTAELTECEQQLMRTLRENCKVIKRMVEGSCPDMPEETDLYSTQSRINPASSYSAGAKSRDYPDSPQFAAPLNGISTPNLLRMFEEVMVCLDQIDLALDRDAVEAIPANHPVFSSEPASSARKLGPGSSLRLLSAELRLKAAVVASAAGSVRAKLEHSTSVRARLAAAADGLAAQLAHERRSTTALRAKADAELARAMKLEAEVGRLNVELERATRQAVMLEEKVSTRLLPSLNLDPPHLTHEQRVKRAVAVHRNTLRCLEGSLRIGDAPQAHAQSSSRQRSPPCDQHCFFHVSVCLLPRVRLVLWPETHLVPPRHHRGHLPTPR
jgi:hypothetical protein